MSLIEYEIKNRIGYITLNRPEKMNAVTYAMLADLISMFEDIRKNPDVWVGIITGRGKAFCAGHDLSQPKPQGPVPTVVDLYSEIKRTDKPILAAVNGTCLAQGCLIALSTDIQVASTEARFGWPNTKRGFTSIGGPVQLAKKIPLNKACEYLFTGEFISAQDALELGLVNRVVLPEELMPAAEEIARKILSNAPLAVRGTKDVLMKTRFMQSDDEAFAYSKLIADNVKQTEDAKEGISAFKEKRSPLWKSR